MKLRVAVLYGGRSGEHEVSIRSAKSIMAALDPEKYTIVEYFISKDGRWSPQPISPEPGANSGIDVVIPVLHGTFGEDGTIQGLLDLAELPYVGPGVMASSIAMDKEMMKRVCVERGLPVVEYLTFHRSHLDASRILSNFHLPVFVKPANLGSSVGISKAKTPEQLDAALTDAARYDRKIIVERAIVGRELECAVLGNDKPEAAIPCEIHPSREFYDYEDKYLLDKAVVDLPAKLETEVIAEIRRLAVECFMATGCEGMARVDFLLEKSTGNLYINEINTIPGFTSISMYPKMWEAAGVPMPALLDRLIALALERHEQKQATRYTRD